MHYYAKVYQPFMYWKCMMIFIFVNGQPVESDVVEITVTYSSLSAAVGQQVKFQCHTNLSRPVEWWHTPAGTEQKVYVFIQGNVTAAYRDRLRMDMFAMGDYDVVLDKVLKIDAGTYTCLEDRGYGARHNILLTVEPYISVKTGNKVILYCSSKSPYTEWHFHHKNGKEDLLFANGTHYKNGFTVPRTSVDDFGMVIENVTLKHSGYYTCVADNGMPQKHVVEVIAYLSASVGDNVTLPCHPVIKSDVDWYYHISATNSQEKIVYTNKNIQNGYQYRGRHIVDSSIDGEHNLIIIGVELNDTGLYICVEKDGFGQKHLMELRVNKENPTFDSKLPVSTSANNSVTTAEENTTFDSKLPVITSVNNTITIAASITSVVILISTGILGVWCYRRKRKLKPRCAEVSEAEVSDAETILLMHELKRYNSDFGSVNMPLEMLELLLTRATVEMIKHVTANGQTESQAVSVIWSISKKFMPILVARKFLKKVIKHGVYGIFRRTPCVVAKPTADGVITGIAVLDEEVYVTCQESNKVNVFSVTDGYNRIEDIFVEGMKKPTDIVACTVQKKMYISDVNCIWQMLKTGKYSQLLRQVRRPYSLSLHGDRLLITPSFDVMKLLIYGINGEEIGQVNLQDFVDKHHAIETVDGSYIVCRPSSTDEMRLLAEVNKYGQITRSFADTSRLGDPRYLATDDNGHVFVADCKYYKVSLFDKCLRLQRDLLSDKPAQSSKPGFCFISLVEKPTRVCYDAATGCLLVGLEELKYFMVVNVRSISVS